MVHFCERFLFSQKIAGDAAQRNLQLISAISSRGWIDAIELIGSYSSCPCCHDNLETESPGEKSGIIACAERVVEPLPASSSAFLTSMRAAWAISIR